MVDLMKIGVGLIVLTLSIVAYTGMIADITGSTVYNVNISGELNTTLGSLSTEFDTLTNTVTSAKNTSFDTESNNEVSSGVGLGDSLLATKNIMTDGIAVTGKLAEATEDKLNIPSYFRHALVAIISFIMVIILLRAVFGGGRI